MRRLLFLVVLGAMLCALVEGARAEVGFWVGPKVVYFRPSNEVTRKTFGNFWGEGAEVGLVIRNRLALSCDVVHVQAWGREAILWMDENGNIVESAHEQYNVLSASLGLSYRFLHNSSPYLGGGWGHYSLDRHFRGTSLSSSSAWAPYIFAGFDYRPWSRVSLRSEWRYQAASGKTAHLSEYLQDMHGVIVSIQAVLSLGKPAGK